MILSSVIIILREALEAALLVSLLLALSNRLHFPKRWIAFAFTGGIAGAILFAEFLAGISSLFDGTGQEVVNASLHFLITAMLAATVIFWLSRPMANNLLWPMAIAVAAAIVREGSEIWIFYSGFISDPDIFINTILGGTIGLFIGVSVGALLYYVLTLLQPVPNRWLSIGLLALVAAGMCSQAINSLTQADYLSSSAAVWNSSSIIDENSIPGQLLYALIGYEATPTLPQVICYALVFCGFIGMGWWLHRKLPQ